MSLYLNAKKISISFVALSLACFFYFLNSTSEFMDSKALCRDCSLLGNMSALDLKQEAKGSYTLEGNFRFSSIPKQISFVFGSYGLNPKDVKAQLTFTPEGGLECTFFGSSPKLTDNSEFFFERGSCPESFALNGKMRLLVESAQLVQLAVWSFPGTPALDQSLIQACKDDICNTGLNGKIYSGNTLTLSSISSRLSWMWGVSEATFLSAFLAAGLILILGAWLLIFKSKYPMAIPCSLFLLSLGIGQLFTWLTPPLQAPDESDHFLTAAYIMAPERLVGEMEGFAKRIHFERIKFRAQEKFLDEHKLEPYPTSWADHVGPVTMELRSPVTWYIWNFLKSNFKDLAIETLLLSLRSLYSLVFSIVIFVISWVLHRGFQSLFFAIPLFSLPSLYFFSMHVSDHSLLTSFQLLFVAMSVGLALKPDSKSIFGVWVLSAALVFTTSRAGLPILLLVPALFFLPDLARGLNQSKFGVWGNLYRGLMSSAALGLCQILLTESFLSGLLGFGADRLPPQWLAEATLGAYFVFTKKTFLFLVPLLYLGFGYVTWALSKRLSWVSRTLNPAGPWLLGALLSCSMLLPWLKPDRIIPDIEGLTRLPLLAYIKKSLHVTGGFLNFGHHDFYGVMSFFGGYGWLETVPPQFYVSILIGVLAAGLAASAFFGLKNSAASNTQALFLLYLGALASLVINAAANYSIPQNLHGRYLIGYFLLVSFICSSGFRQLQKDLPPHIQALVAPLLIVMSTFHYVYIFRFILGRYFWAG
jgi:hypothetical protein